MGMRGEGMVEGSLEVQGARNAASAAAEAAAESAKAAEPGAAGSPDPDASSGLPAEGGEGCGDVAVMGNDLLRLCTFFRVGLPIQMESV